MTHSGGKAIGALALLLLAATPLWSGADPNIYSSFTSYSGTGKHPSSSQTGLIIDKSHNGGHFACVSYALETGKKIKGKVSVQAELVTPEGTRTLFSVNNLKVQPFEFGDPPPSENPCFDEPPPGEPDLDFGFVSDCRQFQADLNPGDVVRLVFKFKKMSKLSGSPSGFQVFGDVIPNAFGPGARKATNVSPENWVRSRILRSPN